MDCKQHYKIDSWQHAVNEYIKELHKLKNLAVDQFGKLNKVEDDLVDQALEWLATEYGR